jgi:hypothetical protein
MIVLKELPLIRILKKNIVSRTVLPNKTTLNNNKAVPTTNNSFVAFIIQQEL